MTKIILDHINIEERLPHSGKMSLLDKVIQSDNISLTALANSHLNADNPLRLNGTISTINGIEYAAQAMAIHGSLLSDISQAGYIVSVRNIEIKKPFLPDIKSIEKQEPLLIYVKQLMSNENGFTYQFDISCEQESFISGKITVFLSQTR
ncbi:MAG: 3-hydroxylacyl-ACP dehydratase [Gammaproteobacteria bacterium]|nr:3-hydroxylacyl-ACP dehydratase [Gammaproteobacteria bacterium]